MLLPIRCWILGDKYNIKEFQDAIMLHMLIELQPKKLESDDSVKLSVEMVRTAFEGTMEGCPLRDLVAARKVVEYGMLATKDEEHKWEELKALDGTGFGPHYAMVHDGQVTAMSLGVIAPLKLRHKHVLWKGYMVGSSQSKGLLLPELSDI